MAETVTEAQVTAFHSAVLSAVARKRITPLVAENALTHVVLSLVNGNAGEAHSYMNDMIRSLGDAPPT